MDTEEVLRRLMRDDWPNPELFDLAVAEVVREARSPLRAFAETVGLRYERGLNADAHQLGKFWDALQRERCFPLVCAYPLVGEPEHDAELIARVSSWQIHRVAAVGEARLTTRPS
ncbi:MAG: hypothetical protein H7323_07435 [Frankiales bacterium]|nr:hypothetical protein [Frankiales bacterium]